MRESDEQLKTKNIASMYSKFVLPDGEPIFPCSKQYLFKHLCDYPDKDVRLPKYSCVLNCCIEFPGVFVTDSKINCDNNMDSPFICSCRYENIISCYLRKYLLPDNVKTYPL